MYIQKLQKELVNNNIDLAFIFSLEESLVVSISVEASSQEVAQAVFVKVRGELAAYRHGNFACFL